MKQEIEKKINELQKQRFNLLNDYVKKHNLPLFTNGLQELIFSYSQLQAQEDELYDAIYIVEKLGIAGVK